jgi:hypothetical protein
MGPQKPWVSGVTPGPPSLQQLSGAEAGINWKWTNLLTPLEFGTGWSSRQHEQKRGRTGVMGRLCFVLVPETKASLSGRQRERRRKEGGKKRKTEREREREEKVRMRERR